MARRSILGIALTAAVRGAGALAVVVLYFIVARVYPVGVAAQFFVLLTATSVATPILMFGYNLQTIRTLAPLDTRAELLSAHRRLRWRFCTLTAASTFVGVAVTLGVTHGSTLAALVVATTLGTIPLFCFAGYSLQAIRYYNSSILILHVVNYSLITLLCLVLSTSSMDPGVQIGLSFCVASLVTLAFAWTTWAVVVRRWSDAGAVPTDDAPPEDDLPVVWLIYVMVAANNLLPQVLYYLSGARADYAYFSVAQRLANVVGFVIIVANFILAPKIARLFHRGQLDELRQLYLWVVRATALMALPLVAVMVLAPGPVLSLFGDDYSAGAEYLSLLAAVQYFNVITGSSSLMLGLTGHQRRLLAAMVTALIVGMAFLAIVRTELGGFGFALAIGITLVLQDALAVRSLRRTIGIRLLDAFRFRIPHREPLEKAPMHSRLRRGRFH